MRKRVFLHRPFLLLLSVVSALPSSGAQKQSSPGPAAEPSPNSVAATGSEPRPSLLLELPLLDVPFNTTSGLSFPSLRQSSAITGSVTQGAHHLFALVWKPEITDRSPRGLFANRRLGGLCSSILLFDLLSPFAGWTHEEGHRAVLSRRGISSTDDIYRNPFASMVSVSHVRDEDLAALKDRHPTDMVRLAEIGGEAQIETILRMRKAVFFGMRTSAYDLLDWWINIGSLGYYVWLCGDDEANRITEEETLKEDADIAKRDIVGGDYLTWVYDLFRPDETYLSGVRGRPHPSGVGVDRYIQPSELTGDERRYLRLQGRLIFLNLLSPQMIGFDRFRGTNLIDGKPIWWNAAVTHHLTPFGTATGLHLLAQQGMTNLAVTYTSHISRYKYWPGLSLELVRYPVTIAGKPVALSSAVSGWLQPCGQRFASRKARGGGGIMLGLAPSLTDHLQWYVECDAKTKGWVAGNVYLEEAFQARLGLIWSL